MPNQELITLISFLSSVLSLLAALLAVAPFLKKPNINSSTIKKSRMNSATIKNMKKRQENKKYAVNEMFQVTGCKIKKIWIRSQGSRGECLDVVAWFDIDHIKKTISKPNMVSQVS